MLSTVRPIRRLRPSAETLIWPITAALLVVGSLLPEPNADMLNAVGRGLLSLLPVVAIAALLAGALTVGRWSDRALAWLKGGQVRAIVAASIIGAVTPVCGLGMLPLIATLLRRGLPLAPVMAFWISSPITDPSMLLITASIIGVPFAVAKTVSAFGIGLLAGAVTSFLPSYRNASHELIATRGARAVRVRGRAASFLAGGLEQCPADHTMAGPRPWSWRCFCTGWCPTSGWYPFSVRTQAHRSPWPLS